MLSQWRGFPYPENEFAEALQVALLDESPVDLLVEVHPLNSPDSDDAVVQIPALGLTFTLREALQLEAPAIGRRIRNRIRDARVRSSP
ncbi:MAG: hypothetical protein KDK33_16545 [Leptospiraceae bacterium]|nr:hypothetical protein [Leptospiraceae bacterium]